MDKPEEKIKVGEYFMVCEFYPSLDDGPVCWAGLDISGLGFWCTHKNSLECQWANLQREQEKGGDN